jgi:hypothetical protein
MVFRWCKCTNSHWELVCYNIQAMEERRLNYLGGLFRTTIIHSKSAGKLFGNRLRNYPKKLYFSLIN